MSVRAFKYFTIGATSTPQPLIGTALSAAVAVPINVPDLNVALTTLPVLDSSMFSIGDWVMLDSTGVAAEERVLVFSVPNATSIKVKGMLNAHASGAFVRLAVLANDIYIQPADGNSAALYVGTSSSLSTTTGAFAIKKLLQTAGGTQPQEFYIARHGVGANPEDVGQYWIAGTLNDKYLASFWQQ
jgi:hypothetical protein